MYSLLDDQSYKIDRYQTTSPFASFLPGLAGEDGIPMWVFYVNRGQAIASFGVQDKNNAMTEFYPADKSYQMVPSQGFRTFIKGKRENETFYYEAFKEQGDGIQDSMIMSDNLLELKHYHNHNQLGLDVVYYTLPHQTIPALVRELTITNTSSAELELELLDGIATLFPARVEQMAYKSIGNTLKSWFDVDLIDDTFGYYYMRGSTADEAAVNQVEDGNFFAALLQTDNNESLITPIYDRECVFGHDLTLQQAEHFKSNHVEQLTNDRQVSTNKVACGFAPVSYHFKANETIKLISVIGQSPNREKAKAFVNKKLTGANFIQYQTEARQLAKALTQTVETKTAHPYFDAYLKQSYLDNGLRGGFPVIFENKKNRQVFYLYSRKHGDLERDYNFFSISPTFYSQGNGNYRDMNQNRRLDVLFDPRIEDYNIRQFVNLIQLDGYNPLALKSVTYTLAELDFDFSNYGISQALHEQLREQLTKRFTPGDVKAFLDRHDQELTVPFEQFLTDVLTSSDEVFEAEHGEGFWIDHWTYNLDLIDSYLAVYPDRRDQLLFRDGYRYFDSPATVNPQYKKYVKQDQHIRQYDALSIDEEKLAKQRQGKDQWLRTNQDKDKLFMTNLYSKLFLLAANKIATIAPFGLGIEMEAGKPGWNDALNGLPGMLGSSTSELYELKRLLQLIKLEGETVSGQVSLPIEAGQFIEALAERLTQISPVHLNLKLWQELTQIREQYRATIRQGITGVRFKCDQKQADHYVTIFSQFADLALSAVESFKEGLTPTYFYFDATVSDDNQDIIVLKPYAVTPFLEGMVKQLKLTSNTETAKALYRSVKQSPLYDKKLGMYKTSGSIESDPIELGRAKFFTPGWLENESIFLHMSYKYLLELLKKGLYDEFYQELQTGLVAFTEPGQYGRSILENVSFIASSANPDPNLHGKGFVARLSGSTVEFLNMWFIMFVGQKPFSYREEKQLLVFQLAPSLPAWLFDQEGYVHFKLFGQIDVSYSNSKRADTYGKHAVKPVEYKCQLINGEQVNVKGSAISGNLAEQIRSRQVKSIHVRLD